MRSVYVFPGQGSQHKGMGEGLFEKFPELVARADACLGYSLKELCLRDPDKVLARTEYTQPALYVVNVLTYLDRTSGGELPDVVAGHSLGEYSALFVAGAFDFLTGLQLVRKRGELMSRAPKGAMAAVVRLDQRRVDEILKGSPFRNVDIANINSREQCIVSGEYDEVFAPELRTAFTDAGAAFIPLNVSAAFHSRCMTEVEEEFARYLAGFELHALTIPVVANWTARLYPEQGYAEYLTRQISSPVKWYESISWLIGQGYRTFHEIGPGRVLAKLTDQILKDPLPPAEEPPTTVVSARPRTELVFMYGGQGTQYHQMGRGLYDTHPAFRRALDRCSAAHRAAGGASLVDAIYDDARKGREYDSVLTTHAALYSIGYSLTEALREEGVLPGAVLGHSLGEYVAATVAGSMDFEDGLRLVMRQARLLAERSDGGMLSILTAPSLFADRPDLFGAVTLAGVNYEGNFLVSGAADRLVELQAGLDREGVIAVPLPVRQAFHSSHLDAIRPDVMDAARTVPLRSARLPLHSATHAATVDPGAPEHRERYLWDVIRGSIRFDELMVSAFPEPERHFFVDLSASGSFANFLKHGYGPSHRGAPAINRFGNDTASLRRLREALPQE
ncbi:ACP S-malonyltransferase [Streptomyces sp. ADI93-02]|uniref:ACP S-malonyltransferase n=1 Tax=Streptomyces sp. ADI93-02 TaxID=1522757 RepID=UPI000F557032|nr:ACP S-malonyltransferase [Streptomyces sp. ADI93-02]RPK48144.1 Polyketide biosynthesis malonyl CoA-acyl carrier protein transacylase BaeC [Streptomyces sp. ADI93-02]